MNHHLIIGHGEWAKKNINYLKNNKIFKTLTIKTKKYFINSYDDSIINNSEIKKLLKKIDTLHICTPFRSHFGLLKKYNKFKKTIIEKPFVNNVNHLNKLKKIYQNKFLIVNYIDTFNPLLKKIIFLVSKGDISLINFNYSDPTRKYKYKNKFAIEWLDHPLSLILYLFRNFPDFKIFYNKSFKIGNQYKQKTIITYNFKEFIINIKLNCSQKKNRSIQIYKKKKVYKFDLVKNSYHINQKKKFQADNDSFDIFYQKLKQNKKDKIQNFNFHKKIILERNRILRKLY